MQYPLIFVLLLTFVFGLGLIARRLSIPYPILFVLGGLAIGFIPILPHQLELNPDLVFFLFLPPLLYMQAFYTSWRDFRIYLRPILLLAVGLVMATTLTVAFVAHWLIPGLPLSAGFVLGAIISPPDAIAASAIAQRLGLPRRVVTILEGESLVNDATSLVIFRVGLAAVGMTIPAHGEFWLAGQFIYVAAGGIAVGVLLGRFISWVRHRLANEGPQIFLSLSLMTPYVSYLLADQFLHVSGVLAVVATGLYIGFEAPETMSPSVRLQAAAVWEVIVFLLNGIVFVLIGLQLPLILSGLEKQTLPEAIFYALVINLICIVIRLAWIFPGAYLPFLIKKVRDREEMPDWRQVFIVGWSGMRGIVSLAAALTLQGYPNFPQAHLVQFIAFSVILVTLVFQGLTLPPLIRYLGVGDDGIPAKEEHEARELMSQAAFEKINEMKAEEKFPSTAIEVVETLYRERVLNLQDELADQLGWSRQRHHFLSVRRLNRLTVATQRRILVSLHHSGKIGDDVLHKIEHELDLEEARLKS